MNFKKKIKLGDAKKKQGKKDILKNLYARLGVENEFLMFFKVKYFRQNLKAQSF